MNTRKVFRAIGKVLFVILLIVVLLLLISSIIYHIKLNNVEKQLKEAGYYAPISVGDHSLNLYSCGNENGQHTIIAMAGWGDGETNIGWRQMTAEIEKDNRLIFLDRPGYGLSDDTAQNMIPENVVEEYRAALKCSGIEAPYLLMGHSMGGLYATYWVSKYPDEIEAVVFVDGECCYEIPEEERIGGGFTTAIMPVIEKLGFAPLVIESQYGKFLQSIPEDKREQALYMMCRTIGSSAAVSEMNNDERNIDFVWKQMVTTEMPKLYISATIAYHTKEDFINDGIAAASLVGIWTEPSLENADDDAIYEEALKLMETTRREKAEPYIEKLGNCKLVELPGDHVIFLDKPDECGKIIKEFLDGLDS